MKKKNNKNQSEIAACEHSEHANFCSNTVFSLYFKIRANNCTSQNHSLFCSTSCFGLTKIYSNLSSKIMKMCEEILKNIRKNSAND